MMPKCKTSRERRSPAPATALVRHPADLLIEVTDATAAYENRRARTRLIALRDVTLSVRKGEFLAIVGPSGCGKTTFINMIAGFVKPTGGTVKVRGREVSGPGADRAMVFQNYALLPWRTVADNVEFAMENKRGHVPKAQRADRIAEVLQLVGLTWLREELSA